VIDRLLDNATIDIIGVTEPALGPAPRKSAVRSAALQCQSQFASRRRREQLLAVCETRLMSLLAISAPIVPPFFTGDLQFGN